uniref:HECT-type E3 ubiquitin transferase n=1 Tax=Kalanchoe fedtschenkoi TaxID=63787 RepID=A0A7N0T0D4_KALFE
METRSRKRAEASSAAPSPTGPATRAAKRTRLSTSSAGANSSSSAPSTNANVASGTRSRPVTRSQELLASAGPMDESSGSGGRRESGGRKGRSGNNADKDGSDKGKEKEHDVRVRERNRELERGLFNLESGGGVGEDDDNDSDGAAGLLHQNLTSASSALQGLLRKLGAGLDDLLPSSAGLGSASHSQQNGRLKKILSGLRADGEEGKQVEALTQLCDMLSMIGTEDSLSTFSVDSFVPVLVGLLNHEVNPDIMLLAARALTHLCDVLPSSCAAVVHYGAVPCFCARLLTIEYMDLAEQSLQALKKISQEHPTACLRAGALMAVLSYLDFFSTGVQRVALSTAANMCKKLPSDAADFVMEAVPLLTNLLQYHDSKVLEHAAICLTRIAEAFDSCPEKLDELCNHGLVVQAAALISTSNSGSGQASLSAPTYTGLIRLLAICASGSPLGAKTLLLSGISGTLKDILSGSGVVSSMSVSPALSRPPEQIFEIVNLANELLPPLPIGTISIPGNSNIFVRGSLLRNYSGSSSVKPEEAKGSETEASARAKLLNDQPELLQQFGMDLLPVAIQIYGSSVNAAVRHKCLSIIGKLMFFSPPDMIQSLLGTTNIPSFLAGVLAWKDPQVLIPALQIAKILMEKLPEIFSKMFVREGVVHAVDTLIFSETSNAATPQPPAADKDNDCVSGSSRSRRYQKRAINSTAEGTPVDESKTAASLIIGSSPGSTETPNANSTLRTAVSACAKTFKDKYFPPVLGNVEVGVTDDLLLLKNLCVKLNSGMEDPKTKSKGKPKASGYRGVDTSASREENLIQVLNEMLVELSKGDGVSTFEFIGSGVVDTLLNYFSCGHFTKDKISAPNLPKLRQEALRRYRAFVSVSLPSGINEGSSAPMTLLIQKLQDALSSLERFPVVLSHSSRTTSGISRLSSGLSALSQPFKLRLCRASGEKSLRDYSSNVILIDPLASLASVEDFLWHRVQRSDSGAAPKSNSSTLDSDNASATAGVSSLSTSTPAASTRRHSSRTRTAVSIGEGAKKDSAPEKTPSSSKGKGKAILKPAQEESKESKARTASRIREALSKEELKLLNGDPSFEDEEFDISPVEIDDALVMEDDDMSDDDDDDEDDHDDVLGDSLPLCTPDKVHDVKLGDTAEDSSAAPAATGTQTNAGSGSGTRAAAVKGLDDYRVENSYSSRGTMSFAAAAMAGLTSTYGSRGFRGGRDRLGRPIHNHNDPPKLTFFSGGKQLNRNLTIYQAVQRHLILDDDEDRYSSADPAAGDGSRLWGDIYTITYQKADAQSEKSSGGNASGPAPSKSVKSSSSNSDASSNRVSLLDSILQGILPCDLERSNPTYNILALLRVLEGLNQLAPRLRLQALSEGYAEGNISSLDELNVSGSRVPAEDFINPKLTPKLARQIQDALALCSGSLPSWCYQLTKACPFLFPFETRRQYFYSTAFGLSRALHRLQSQQGAGNHGTLNEREVRVGRLQRQKVRVSRTRILDSAAKVMEMYSSQKAVLEVEYFGEVGTGLGPTLEFYTLLSHDLQKASLGMWRSNSSSHSQVDSKTGKPSGAGSEVVDAPLGLFPRPWAPSTDSAEGSQFCKVIDYFRLVGRTMAKALQDGRLLDLPMSPAFYKLVIGQELDLHDIISFDADLGKILQELQVLVSRKYYLESHGGNNDEAITDLRFRGSLVEDLCLDFTVPGYPDYVLKPGDENVNIHNLEEYISLVVDAMVKTGITRQIEAFRAGFNQVFDIATLQIFSPGELDYLLCGRREMWKAESLADHIKFDHGYTAKSPAIINLLEIMGEFTPEQQRAFCQFVTGAPRLPPGGLAVLNPKLTIVRKHSSTVSNAAALNGMGPSESADDDLPSVMTCANYLKLPPYSTKEIMYKKLLYAINEGQGSFDLS